jgi:4-hydroxybenzoate polyprenyltransferase
MALPAAADLAELVRLPAVLSVPGDVLVGAASSGRLGEVPRTAGLVAASSCLYLAGMALNDYADRDVDATERPGRPIPSGRVTAGFALGTAGVLTVGALALSTLVDGTRALAVTVPLTAAVWGYDLVLKRTSAASTAMSLCRALDVVAGAGAAGARAALPAATLVAAHTAMVTEVSRREVTGANPEVPKRALAATVAVGTATALLGGRTPRLARCAAVGLCGTYAATVGGAHAAAIDDPSPPMVKRAVGAGVLGLILLEAGLLAGAGAVASAIGLAALWPVARGAARKRAVT